MGMTVEEYKAHLTEQKYIKMAQFEAQAEAEGMTLCEYKKYLAEEKSE